MRLVLLSLGMLLVLTMAALAFPATKVGDPMPQPLGTVYARAAILCGDANVGLRTDYVDDQGTYVTTTIQFYTDYFASKYLVALFEGNSFQVYIDDRGSGKVTRMIPGDQSSGNICVDAFGGD